MPAPVPRKPALARIRQGLKILASGMLFTCLGVGGAFFTFLVLPALKLMPGGRAGLNRRAGWLIHRSFKLFVWALEASRILRVQALALPGPDQLRGTLILSNHPSYLDVVVIISLLPRAVCVVKQAVYDSCFFGSIVRAAGYIPIGGSGDVLAAGRDALRDGKTLVIFPEGTRSQPGRPFNFQRGAAHLAQASGARILPLVVTCVPGLLEKGHRWYHVPVETCQFIVRAGDATPFEALLTPSPTPRLAAQRLISVLETFYNTEVHGLSS
jgi:1-acyl-sn-glycerol-3-phosphate acyltransferase